MQKTPDDIYDEPERVAEPPRRDVGRGSRTAAAARDFLTALRGDANALGGDAAAFAARSAHGLGQNLRQSLAEWRRSYAERQRRLEALAQQRSAARAASPRPISPPPIAPPRRSPPPRPHPWTRAGGRVLGVFGVTIVLLGVFGALTIAGAMLWTLSGLTLDQPMTETDAPSLLLEAADGGPLGRIGPLRAADAAISDFSPVLIKAVVSIEDHRFFHHIGIDPLGIIRAAHRNAESGGIAEGGSTITQQLVKMRYVGRDRTYRRKLREALTAVWLETHLGKDEILRRYLNAVYLGAGAYGMAAASRLYFDKAPADLTLPEAAMLAGLIQAPTQYNPIAHLQVAQTRAATVLDAMVDSGAIDAQAAAAAKADPAIPKVSAQMAPAASWFADWIAGRAGEVSGARTGSVRVRTTLMPALQKQAQDILDTTLARDGARLGVTQGALVAMRPDGAVLAMVGGRDYRASQFNRAVEASRQPGSSFKLFVYLTALRKGYTPGDTVDASAIDIKGWEPENYGGEAASGRMTLADAFAHSVNTAAVHLAMDVGLNNVIATARDLGIDTPLQPYPSLALGAVGANLLEMTSAYASVRADRMHISPWGIAAVSGTNGDMQPAAPPAPTRTLGPYQQPMIELMRGVVEHGTGRGAALDGFAAGKTGTSQDFRDAWFIGFNDTLVVGVWLGNDDNSPTKHVTGGSLPASIWRQFMTAATPLVQQAAPVAAAAPASDAQQADADPAQPGDQATASNACDPQACAGAYSSFRASDCTYQPFSGGRRLCPIASRTPGAMAQTSTPATQQPEAPQTSGVAPTQGGAQCNADACARTYSSFNASDCTYQPFGGGARQLCTR